MATLCLFAAVAALLLKSSHSDLIQDASQCSDDVSTSGNLEQHFYTPSDGVMKAFFFCLGSDTLPEINSRNSLERFTFDDCGTVPTGSCCLVDPGESNCQDLEKGAHCNLITGPDSKYEASCSSGVLAILGVKEMVYNEDGFDYVLDDVNGHYYLPGGDTTVTTQPDGSHRFSPDSNGNALSFTGKPGDLIASAQNCDSFTGLMIEQQPLSLLASCAEQLAGGGVTTPSETTTTAEPTTGTPTTGAPTPGLTLPATTAGPTAVTNGDCCGVDAAGNPYGVFSGIVNQNNAGTHKITIDYSPEGIITTYPDSNCGNVNPDKPVVSQGVLQWTERIDYGATVCVPGGSVTLSLLQGNQWNFFWIFLDTTVEGPLTYECDQPCSTARPQTTTPPPIMSTTPAPPVTSNTPTPMVSTTPVPTTSIGAATNGVTSGSMSSLGTPNIYPLALFVLVCTLRLV